MHSLRERPTGHRVRADVVARIGGWVGDAAVVVLAALATGCGGGTVAIVGGGSSSSNPAAASVSNVTVSDTKTSPAVIGFTLRGQSVESARLEYILPPAAEGGSPVPVPIVTLGADELLVSKSGVTNEVLWSFVGDLGPGFRDGLTIRVTLGNGERAETSTVVSVGNDPPQLTHVELPEAEVVGLVPFFFTVVDDDDIVNVVVEVNAEAAAGFPESGWTLATSDNPSGSENQGQLAVPEGTQLSFHWDVQEQFPALDSEVMVRITADEEILDQDCVSPRRCESKDVFTSSEPIRVDNNQPPFVDLDDAAYLQNGDQRLGIVVPYSVSDAEGDALDLVFQWSREGEPFPELPDDGQALDEILADPALRKQYRIATQYPMPLGGRVVPQGPETVELPELASSQAHLLRVAQQQGGDLTHALDGYELELLRTSSIPEPLAASWAIHPLNHPVAAIPLADGLTVLVLDRTGNGRSRLREIDLATGAVVREIATGNGEPDAMAMEHGGQAVLVADHFGSHWRVGRVDLETGEQTVLFDVNASAGDVIRGLVSQGTHVALATSGDRLLRLDSSVPGVPRVVTLLDGLATPWGLALDPLDEARVYVAERGGGAAGRVLTMALDTRAVQVLVTDPPGLPHPETLAFERHGRSLLVLTDEVPSDGRKELRTLEPSAGAAPSPALLVAELPEAALGLATGDDGLRVIALGGMHDIAVGGGLAQRCTIVGYDPSRRLVHVGSDFVPAPSANQSWRVRRSDRLSLQAGSPRLGALVWDSSDLAGGSGVALLRLQGQDADAVSVAHDGGKQILSCLQRPPVSLDITAALDRPACILVADVDGDGAMDLVSANEVGDSLAVFFQTAAGTFDPEPVLIGSPALTDGARCVAAADMDGDADVDLVSANANGDTLTVFFQTAAGGFDPLPLGNTAVTDGPQSVAVADLDGDADMDLVCANANSDTLTIFFQTAAGEFELAAPPLGGPAVTDGPQCVTVADVDGDGSLDIVSANAGSDTLTVFFGTGMGGFDPAQRTLGGPAVTNGPQSVAVADVDGDGAIDIASANELSSSLTVFFQTAARQFDAQVSLASAASIVQPNSIDIADVDGDGALDLACANGLGDTLAVFFQLRPREFDPIPLALGSTETTDRPQSVAAADVDGDGRMDLACANSFSDTLALFLQSGPGTFDHAAISLGNAGTTNAPDSVLVTDIDGDGDLDVVSANVLSRTLTLFFQTAVGAFDPVPQSLLVPENGALLLGLFVAAADVDGDGDMDLVSARPGPDTITIFTQDSPGTFHAAPASDLGVFAVNLAVGDLDADGDLDFAVPDSQGDSLKLVLQSSPGVFGVAPRSIGSSDVFDAPGFVAAADVDADGAMDLVSLNAGSDNVTVFFQSTVGSFDQPPLAMGGPDVMNATHSVAVADVDGDGRLDLVATSLETLDVFFQRAAGAFDREPTSLGNHAVTHDPRSVAVADVDGDGGPDLVSANLFSNSLTLFFQTRAGAFEPTPLSLGGPLETNAPRSLAVADVDGDGDLDLVSANSQGDNLTVFLNAHGP